MPRNEFKRKSPRQTNADFAENLREIRVISRLTLVDRIPSLRPPRGLKHRRTHLLTST